MSEGIDATAMWTELKARQDIHDVVVRWCRGIDRHDRDLILSAYHPDGWDDHGSFSGPAEKFADWALELQSEHYVSTKSFISNEYVEIRGDKASAETYINVYMRFKRDGELYDLIGAGRYLDKFECRNGQWKIAHRLVVLDSDRIDRVAEVYSGDLTGKLVCGTRSKDDPSYAYFAGSKTSK